MKIKSFIDLFLSSEDSFEGQERGEDVILILRKHVFVIYSQLLVFFVSICVPAIIGKIFQTFISTNNIFTLFIFLSSMWYLLAWMMMFYSLTMYSLNVVIVTNTRIIDSRQNGFFDRRISELHLSRVQDISVHTSGLMETMFRFGSVEVQTASEERQFIFKQLPNPEHVKDVIMDLANTDEKNKNM